MFNLHRLRGISDRTVDMHMTLYTGYVTATNELTEHIFDLVKDGKVDHEEMPFGYACTPCIQSSVAGCVAKNPLVFAPSACISHVSVAAMIRVPSRPMTWAAPASCASDSSPAQGPRKAQGQRGAMRWRVGSEAWSCFSPWLRLSPSL